MKLRKLLVLLLLLGAAFILSACGEQGVQGETGLKGPTGETGAQGPKGDTGAQGDQGAKGDNGADGLGIEFSFTSEGLAWRYVGQKDWNVGVEYTDIFEIMAKLDVGSQQNEVIKALSFDYYVNPSLSGKNNGDAVIAYEKSFVMGTTAFTTIGDAVAAVNAASKEAGYEGAAIFVASGEYEEYVAITADNVTLYGNNAERDPRDGASRAEETVLKGCMQIEGKGIEVNGFCWCGENTTEAFTAAKAADTSVIDESAKANVVIIGDDARLCYNTTSDLNKKQYMICLGKETDASTISGAVIDHNFIYPKRTGGDVRPIRGIAAAVKDVNIYENEIKNNEPEGSYSDAIRLNSITGTLTIERNNVGDWSSNNWGFFLGFNKNTTTEMSICGNILGDDEYYNSGISIRHIPMTDCEIKIQYNTFHKVSGLNVEARFELAEPAAENCTTLDVQYNKYLSDGLAGTVALKVCDHKTTSTPHNNAFASYVVFNNNYADYTFTSDNTTHVPTNTYASEDKVPAMPIIIVKFTGCVYNAYSGSATNVYMTDMSYTGTGWLYYTKVILDEQDGKYVVTDIVGIDHAKPATYAWIITACDPDEVDLGTEYFADVEIGMYCFVDKEKGTVAFYR